MPPKTNTRSQKRLFHLILFLSFIGVLSASPQSADIYKLVIDFQLSFTQPFIAAVEAEQTPKSEDVVDTHQRIDKIYKKLGIKQKKTEYKRHQGCQNSQEASPRKKNPSKQLKAPQLPPMLGWVLLAVVILAILIPIVWMVINSYKAHYPEEEKVEHKAIEEDDDHRELIEEEKPLWEVSLAECRKAFNEGRLVEAFAALHRLALIVLDDKGYLQLDVHKTNWDYVRQLSSRPIYRILLSSLTIAAESSVLGEKPPQPEHYHELEAQLIKDLELKGGQL